MCLPQMFFFILREYVLASNDFSKVRHMCSNMSHKGIKTYHMCESFVDKVNR